MKSKMIFPLSRISKTTSALLLICSTAVQVRAAQAGNLPVHQGGAQKSSSPLENPPTNLASQLAGPIDGGIVQEYYQNNRLDSLEKKIVLLEQAKTQIEARLTVAERQVAVLQQTVTQQTDWVNKIPALAQKTDQLESALATQGHDLLRNQERMATVEQKTAHLREANLDGRTSVIIENANLVLRNGTGGTGNVNGLGNLILGYNGAANVPQGVQATRNASHSLIIGDGHQYGGHSNIVSGRNNRLTVSYSSILSGDGNAIVSGNGNAILGGQGNAINGAYGEHSVISGGAGNTIRGSTESIIVGGEVNLIDAQYRGVIVGGLRNWLLENSDHGVMLGGVDSRMRNSPLSVHGGGNAYTLRDESRVFSAGTVIP